MTAAGSSPAGRTIVHVIDDLGLGGAQRQLVALLTRWPAGDRVHVISLSDVKTAYEADLAAAGVDLRRVPHRGRWSWATLRGVREMIATLKPDVVHTWLFTSDLYGRLAAFAEGVPCVISAIRNTVDDMPWHYRLVNRALAPKTSAFTINAEAIRAGLVRAVGMPPAKVHVVPNGIDLANFPPVARNGAYRREWQLPADAQVTAMVARFAPQKDHATFLEAAERVARAMPRAYFVLVGDGAGRPASEARARSLGIADRVRFTGARRDVWSLLHHVDLCVLATHFEGSSNVILEAMTAGRPVVATDAGGNAELIVPTRTGWLVPPRDPQALAAAIEAALRDPARAEAMGQEGRRRIESHFSIDATVRRTAALYDELLSRN